MEVFGFAFAVVACYLVGVAAGFEYLKAFAAGLEEEGLLKTNQRKSLPVDWGVAG